MAMNNPARRVPNVPESDWTPEVRDVFTVMEGLPTYAKGSGSNCILAWANHPRAATVALAASMGFQFLLRANPAERELVILRVCWLRQTQYEWGHHYLMGQAAGLSQERVEAAKAGPSHPIWSDRERLLLQATDEFCSDAARVSDETWAALSERFSLKEIIELLFLAGEYEMYTRVMNSMRIEIEPEVWNDTLPPP
jgi:alkylhydroperoxidase family enzyme